jgi:predicted nucleotidyltransferase
MLKQENKYILEIKKTVIALLKDEKVKVMLFGSRARGNNYPYSDVDVGILPTGKFDEKKLTLLKETIENLPIPYKIES